MKKRTRVLSLLVILLMVATIVAGCGQKAEEPKKEQPQQQQQAQPEVKKLKVGLVFDVGGRGDLSFNDSAYAGLEKASKDFKDKIEVNYLEPSQGGENREELLRLLAEQKYDLIFGVGFLFTDHIAKVAKEFPATKFGLIDGFIPDLTKDSNVSSLLFKENEGSFLVGAAAAMKSKTGKIGFVGGMKIPLIEKFEAGYVAGAKYVNPKIQVLSDYIGTTGDAFKDPAKGKELALAHYNKGSDIEYHASGASGTGVIEAAVTRKLLVIGVDSDQSLTAPEAQRQYILTSMMKRVDNAVYSTISDLVAGKFEGGYKVFGLAEDGVGYAINDFNKAMMSDIIAKLDELKGKIIKGEIEVPADKASLESFLAKLSK